MYELNPVLEKASYQTIRVFLTEVRNIKNSTIRLILKKGWVVKYAKSAII